MDSADKRTMNTNISSLCLTLLPLLVIEKQTVTVKCNTNTHKNTGGYTNTCKDNIL